MLKSTVKLETCKSGSEQPHGKEHYMAEILGPLVRVEQSSCDAKRKQGQLGNILVWNSEAVSAKQIHNQFALLRAPDKHPSHD